MAASGRLSVVTDLDDPRQLVPEWLPLPDVADALGLPVTRVRQMLRERHLVALRRDGVLQVPAAFLQDGVVVKGLPGTLTVLADSGYDDEASVRWLFTEDPTLPGTPLDALRADRGTEVRRRAQALAF